MPIPTTTKSPAGRAGDALGQDAAELLPVMDEVVRPLEPDSTPAASRTASEAASPAARGRRWGNGTGPAARAAKDERGVEPQAGRRMPGPCLSCPGPGSVRRRRRPSRGPAPGQGQARGRRRSSRRRAPDRWTMVPTGMAPASGLRTDGRAGQVLAELLPAGPELFEPGPVLLDHGRRRLGHEVGVLELAFDLGSVSASTLAISFCSRSRSWPGSAGFSRTRPSRTARRHP